MSGVCQDEAAKAYWRRRGDNIQRLRLLSNRLPQRQLQVRRKKAQRAEKEPMQNLQRGWLQKQREKSSRNQRQKENRVEFAAALRAIEGIY